MNPGTTISGCDLPEIIKHGKLVKTLLEKKEWGLLEGDIADYKDDATKVWYEHIF